MQVNCKISCCVLCGSI